MHPRLAAGAICLVASSATKPAPELGEVVEEMSDALWIVFQDSKLRHWFGSDGQGVYCVEDGTIVRYTTQDGLANDHLRQILEDDSGNLYFNTNGGISKFDGRRFSTLVPVESENSANEWKLAPADLWFTLQPGDGPARYDGEWLHRLVFPASPVEDLFRARFPSVPYSPYCVYSILRDRSGALWFGTSSLGVCRYDGASFTWITEDELTELDPGPSVGVRGIVEDRDGRFWLSNLLHRYAVPPTGGPQHAAPSRGYAKETGIVTHGPKGPLGPTYFMSGLTDVEGVSWFATYGEGVWRYDGKRLSHFPVVVSGQPITLSSIHEDHEGVLWLGTQANGAWRFDGETFERFRP